MTVRRTQRGFGLIELLVTLAVLTMIFSIGVPSYENFSKKNRAVSHLEELNAGLRLARQVAIEHNFRARVCAKASNTLNTTSCGSPSDWHNGFLVQVETAASPTSFETIMNKSFTADGTQTAVAQTSTATLLGQIGYNATGNLDSASGPNVAITINLRGCTATTSINITGRISSTPLSGC